MYVHLQKEKNLLFHVCIRNIFTQTSSAPGLNKKNWYKTIINYLKYSNINKWQLRDICLNDNYILKIKIEDCWKIVLLYFSRRRSYFYFIPSSYSNIFKILRQLKTMLASCVLINWAGLHRVSEPQCKSWVEKMHKQEMVTCP